MFTRTPRIHRPWRGWVWLCVVALLGFQSLGLMHRAMHGGALPGGRTLLVGQVERLSLPVDRDSLLAARATLSVEGTSRSVERALPSVELTLPPTERTSRSNERVVLSAERASRSAELVSVSSRSATGEGAATQSSADAAPASAASPETSPAKSAFGHLAGSADCQLLDQLSEALGAPFQALAWTMLLPDVPVGSPMPVSAPTLALWRHDARGPPTA